MSSKPVYLLCTLGIGVSHVITDLELAQRWEKSNQWRFFLVMEVDADLPSLEKAINAETERVRSA